MQKHDNTQTPKFYTKYLLLVGVVGVILACALYFITLDLQPFSAFGGAVWLKHGVHYLTDAQISTRVEEINSPKEFIIADNIKATTTTCDNAPSGFCQKSLAEYYTKTLTTPAVAFVAAIPDKQVLAGYCTKCRDGSWSPTCAVGRGACSWHDGVAAYNVPQYNIIPGRPEIPAKPAVYSFTPKSYKDSPEYKSPEIPSLNVIVGY